MVMADYILSQMKDAVYLGDAVYVNRIGDYIYLFTSDGIQIVNGIYLDHDVADKLMNIIRDLHETEEDNG